MTFYPFGIFLAAGGALALVCAAVLMRRAGLKAETAGWFALLSVPLALALARVGYCACILDYIMSMDDWGILFRVTEGGLLPYGMLLGGLLAAWLTARITRQPAGAVANCAAIPACAVLLAWRLGEGFIGLGRGMDLMTWFDPEVGNSLFHPESTALLERFPFAMQDYYGQWCWAVYVLEAIFAVGIAGVLWLTRTQVRAGGHASLFFLLYAASQVLCESMRRGDVLRWGFVRINQILSAVVIVAVLLIAARGFEPGKRRRQTVSGLVQVALGAVLVMVMEFALEKKITLIEFIPSDVCYVIMAAACAWMAAAVRPAWQASYLRSR